MKDLSNFIKELTKQETRFGDQEVFAFNKIIEELNSNKIDYKIQEFKNFYPKEIVCFIEVDGEKIKCKNTGFVGGEINEKSLILAQDFESDFFSENKSNINYNLNSDEISRISFFQTPSLAVSRKDIEKIKIAEKIKGQTEVKKKSFKSANVLVGNLKDPQNIIFSHYDSVDRGVVDNACGTAIVLAIILKNKNMLKDNLFVFSGSEEISYDQPFYWGKGYRVFENKYFSILQKTKKIIVVDGVGNGNEKFLSDKDLVQQAFPLKNLREFEEKILILTGDLDKLMAYYHSSADDLEKIKKKHLEKAKKLLIDKILE